MSAECIQCWEWMEEKKEKLDVAAHEKPPLDDVYTTTIGNFIDTAA